MIGAYAFGHGIAGHNGHELMPKLRVHQPVHGLAVQHHTAANPRAHGDIYAAAQALGRAQSLLGNGRAVHVGVQLHRHAQGFPEGAHNGVVPPGQLGGGGDITIGGRIRPEVQGPKAADAQGSDVPLPEKVDHAGHGFRRGQGGHAHPLQHGAIFIHQAEHHFRAACFQCAKVHHSVSPLHSLRNFCVLL